jgi:tRNA 2-thiouridine synthesizing protein A
MSRAPVFIDVDARGLHCPLPVLRLAVALAAAAPGSRARLYATDPDSVVDVESYCGETGAKLLSWKADGALFVFEVEKSTERVE